MVDLTLAGKPKTTTIKTPSLAGIDNNFLNTNVLSTGVDDALKVDPLKGFQQGGMTPQDSLGFGTGGENKFDLGGALSNFNTGAQGILGLMNAYSAYKQLGYMGDQIDLQKQAFAANKAVQDQEMADKAHMRDQMVTA